MERLKLYQETMEHAWSTEIENIKGGFQASDKKEWDRRRVAVCLPAVKDIDFDFGSFARTEGNAREFLKFDTETIWLELRVKVFHDSVWRVGKLEIQEQFSVFSNKSGG